jgi:hypothetical protein
LALVILEYLEYLKYLPCLAPNWDPPYFSLPIARMTDMHHQCLASECLYACFFPFLQHHFQGWGFYPRTSIQARQGLYHWATSQLSVVVSVLSFCIAPFWFPFSFLSVFLLVIFFYWFSLQLQWIS